MFCCRNLVSRVNLQVNEFSLVVFHGDGLFAVKLVVEGVFAVLGLRSKMISRDSMLFLVGGIRARAGRSLVDRARTLDRR